MRPGLLALAAATLAAATAASETPAEKLVGEYCAADEPARAELRKKLRGFDKIAAGDVKKWTEFVRRKLAARGPWDGQEPATLRHKDYPITYTVLGDTKGRNLSVLIILHGGGGKEVNDFAWKNMADMARMTKPEFGLVVIPRIWSGMEASWGTQAGMTYLPALIAELKRSFSIDGNRIALYGTSMGAYGACSAGAAAADLFAGFGAELCAAEYQGAWENLVNTPFRVHIGEKDTDTDRIGKARKFRDLMQEGAKAFPGRYALEYKEYPGAGHSLPPDSTREVLGWLRGLKRDPAPKTVVWRQFKNAELKPDDNRYFWWLHAAERGADFRLEAAIRDKNVIEVKTKGVTGFTLFLNDKLVDLKKPVVVVVDGREQYRGTPAPSLSAIVESYAAKEDPELVFTARLDFGK